MAYKVTTKMNLIAGCSVQASISTRGPLPPPTFGNRSYGGAECEFSVKLGGTASKSSLCEKHEDDFFSD